MCYRNIKSCVLNNDGWASNYFTPERGVRQGCQHSPYIFILYAEVLAKKIRANKDIKGITVCGKEIKISKYADDKVDILENKNQQVSKLSMNTDVSGVLPLFSVKNNR